MKSILDKIIHSENSSRFRDSVRRSFSNFMIPIFGKGRFVESRPPSLDGVKFVRSGVVNTDQTDMSQDNAAVRYNNIGQYIKDHNF